MIILGLGGILKDGAAALLRDGELVAAIEENKIARHRSPGGSADGIHGRVPAPGDRPARRT